MSRSSSKTGPSSDIAFTPAVKAIQEERGSRRAYARMEQGGGWSVDISDELATFISAQTSFFLATANRDGQPYVQHRGGPPGFLRVQDERTLAFADFVGNLQYITMGNLSENPKAHLLLIDYRQRRRVKIWAEARVMNADDACAPAVAPRGYDARTEQIVLLAVSAWDWNCPRHIPHLVDVAAVADALQQRDERIAELEAELRHLRQGVSTGD